MKSQLQLLVLVFVAALAAPALTGGSLVVTNGQFRLDGQPFQIVAGEMHYARVPREYWVDRMKKARAMGLNAISTYVFWNLHEPQPGKFQFDGQRDIAAFVRAAQQEGLKVILKPGPYVCAEWDLGGLPSWLLADPPAKLRSTDERFQEAMSRYLKRLGREVAGLQASQGGPIILVQIENEYGFFGSDSKYLERVRDAIRVAGFTEPLYTADASSVGAGNHGSLPDCLAAANFGDRPQSAFEMLRRARPNDPPMCGEFWIGWFDSWGKPHQTANATTRTRDLEWMLAAGGSVCLYVFHGGTTFGFMSGANTYRDNRCLPSTTSYDYDAPLDEAGRPTRKFYAFRNVLARHQAVEAKLPELPVPLPVVEISPFELGESAALEPLLGGPVASSTPLSMEALGQAHGYILYRTKLAGPVNGTLKIKTLHDYAVVLIDGQVKGVLDRFRAADTLELGSGGGQILSPAAPASRGAVLDLLVENTGRINFGADMQNERKGILGGVTLADKQITNWNNYALPMEDLSKLRFASQSSAAPAFRRGHFKLDKVGDTFLDLRGWGKGVLWVNGHNLGRFWQAGPQQTLYCPAPWLKTGANEVVAFETETGSRHTLQGLRDPVWANEPRPPTKAKPNTAK